MWQMLTAQQEARLEAASFPWCPDFWEMTNLLAAKHKQPPAPLLSGLEVSGPALRPLLPLNTAFQFLTKPLMTRGLGMRLKRKPFLPSPPPPPPPEGGAPKLAFPRPLLRKELPLPSNAVVESVPAWPTLKARLHTLKIGFNLCTHVQAHSTTALDDNRRASKKGPPMYVETLACHTGPYPAIFRGCILPWDLPLLSPAGWNDPTL